MTAKVESVVPQSGGGSPKRKLRNYLLDPRFQLKYTLMVVAVTVMVATVLGYAAYDYSRGQSEALTISMLGAPDLNEEAVAKIQADSAAADQRVLMSIVGGILLLVVATGLTGIVVTHRLVGPVYKMKRLLGDVAAGKLKIDGRLRRGDELQDLFEAFAVMVDSLRHTQAEEVAQLDAAIARARAAGIPEEALREIMEVRDRMQTALD